jgi:hypothetical protein
MKVVVDTRDDSEACHRGAKPREPATGADGLTAPAGVRDVGAQPPLREDEGDFACALQRGRVYGVESRDADTAGRHRSTVGRAGLRGSLTEEAEELSVGQELEPGRSDGTGPNRTAVPALELRV